MPYLELWIMAFSVISVNRHNLRIYDYIIVDKELLSLQTIK